MVDAEELLDDLLAMVWALDEPYGGGLPSWYVFRFMGRDVKVGHTGTGGDELFGNYRRFVPFETARLARLRRRPVRRYHFEPSYYFADAEKRGVLLDGHAPDTAALLQRVYDESGSRSARDSVLYLDVATQLPDEFLHMTDRFSMAHSLEARTPFLDHKLRRARRAHPAGAAHGRPTTRRGCSARRSPTCSRPAHLAAPKRGFVFPLARWLRGELRPLAERLLSDDHLRAQGMFRPGLRGPLPRAAPSRASATRRERLWPLLMFQLWHLLYVEEGLTEAPSFALARRAVAA